MSRMPVHKYRPQQPVTIHDRTWPSKTIQKAPMWCSVDLRDGNQALDIPMNADEKLELFRLLVDIGFREIEVGFPAASQVDYEFIRLLIEGSLIPDHVTIQVLTQARDKLIARTFEALRGVQRAIVHLYNSTSELQRRVVFRKGKKEIVSLARQGAEAFRAHAEKMEKGTIRFEYSPESFTGTEPEFALEVCEAVIDVWKPSPENKAILNLPATVEMTTPNVYADRIEWFVSNIRNREALIMSVHAHNDRGTAVAATELGLLAGADRVEGTLFGNGERTGNVDVVTLALNMFSRGVDPELDFHDINRVMDVYERCTRMQVHPRHPYAGNLVYTAFSGSHQDAISKGLRYRQDHAPEHWEVPYLPIDPADVGRTYETIVRINSQSGKGGAAFIMEKKFGLRLPREMHPEFGAVVKAACDSLGKEISPETLWEIFSKEYLRGDDPVSLVTCSVREEQQAVCVTAVLRVWGETAEMSGYGNGPIDAFCNGLRESLGVDFTVSSYHEHSLAEGSDASAIAYIGIEPEPGRIYYGTGMDSSIDRASLRAVISGLNRSNIVKKNAALFRRVVSPMT